MVEVDSSSAVQTALSAETSWSLVCGFRAPPTRMRKASAEARKSRKCGRRGVRRKRRCKPHLRKLGEGGARRKKIRRVARDWTNSAHLLGTGAPTVLHPVPLIHAPSLHQRDLFSHPPWRERNLLIYLHDVGNHLAPPLPMLIFGRAFWFLDR